MRSFDFYLGLVGVGFGIIGIVLILFSSVISFFKLDEADCYFGKLTYPEQLMLKGLPFSLGRMSFYGVVILFWNTRFVRKHIIKGRSERRNLVDRAPVQVKRLLVWLYAGWVISILISALCLYSSMVIKNI